MLIAAMLTASLVLGAAPAPQPRERLNFKDDSGQVAFSLVPEDDGVKLENPGGEPLARIRQLDALYKVKDPNGEELARIRPSGELIAVEDGEGAVRLVLRRGKGVISIADGSGAAVARIDFTASEARLESISGAVRARAEMRDEKVRLEPQHLWTRGVKPEAMAILAYDAVSLPTRVALFFLLNGKRP